MKEASININDEQLMLRYAKGDSSSFTQLYTRYEQSIYRFAYNGCSNDAIARDLFQEIWLRVIKARNSFKPTQPFKAWLFSIARNLLIDHYRRQSTDTLEHRSDKKLDADPDTINLGSLTPEQIASAVQASDTLRTALLCLPIDQREAVMLKHIAGLNIQEIAQAQGQGTQTVKSRLRYAMVKLRQHLKELP